MERDGDCDQYVFVVVVVVVVVVPFLMFRVRQGDFS